MTRKELMRSLGVAAIYGLDFETYYDDTLSLRKMATTEYVTHPDMEVQLVAVQKDSWSKAKVMTATEFKAFARTVDWSRAALLAHHAHFDGLLASHFFGVKPKAYIDTLSMARPVMPVQVGGSLAKLCAAFGLAGKRGAEALVQVKGKRFKQFTKQEIADLKYYAGGDIEQTWLLLDKLLPFIPENEMHVISTTVKMYAQPRLLIDKAMTEQVIAEEQEKKSAKLDAAGAQRAELMSNEQFAALLLERTGIEAPTKISKRTGKVALALSKNDLEFKALLKHSDPAVVALVEARLAIKSTSAETRAERMSFRAGLGAQPVYLNYWGAKTGRWSGGDKCIAAGTKVKVLRSGARKTVAIEAVQDTDLVWDGQEYVSHGGVVFQGRKEVMSYGGIVATPEHKVFVTGSDTPVPLATAKAAGFPLRTYEWNRLRRLCQVAKDRCVNPRNKVYPRYGGRGIRFEFTTGSDMARYVMENLPPRPAGASLDRVNNDEGYKPGNLRWATASGQNKNKRPYAGGTYDGAVRRVLAARRDVTYETVRGWLASGVTEKEAMTKKKGAGGRPRAAVTSPRVGDPRHAR